MRAERLNSHHRNRVARKKYICLLRGQRWSKPVTVSLCLLGSRTRRNAGIIRDVRPDRNLPPERTPEHRYSPKLPPEPRLVISGIGAKASCRFTAEAIDRFSSRHRSFAPHPLSPLLSPHPARPPARLRASWTRYGAGDPPLPGPFQGGGSPRHERRLLRTIVEVARPGSINPQCRSVVFCVKRLLQAERCRT